MDVSSIDRNKTAAIFNEWARQWAENPEDFKDILDEDGNPYSTYGEEAAACFIRIMKEMEEITNGR